jgi:signal transduction histidine kinase
VLHFAKLDAGHVHYDIAPVSLTEVLAELELLIAPQVAVKGLTYVHCRPDPTLVALAEQEKLQQIVLNLVSNAIKFTEPGGRVDVECDADDAIVRVRVRDTGVGIPAERLDVIFDPFVQVDRRLTRAHEGIGLGLAISRDLASGMGGTLSARSVVGRGSVFTLTLPRAPQVSGKTSQVTGDRRHVPGARTPALSNELVAGGAQPSGAH